MSDLHEARWKAMRAYRGTIEAIGPYDEAVKAASTVEEIERIVNHHLDPFGMRSALNAYDRATDLITPPDPIEPWSAARDD